MGNLIVESASIPGKWPAKTESGSLSGGGSSLCRLLGTTLTAPSGCDYNPNPKIPAEEAGRDRKLHRRVHHVLRWAVDDRRWLWTAPKSFSGSAGSAAVVAAGREALQMDGTAVDFDRDSARVRGAILADSGNWAALWLRMGKNQWEGGLGEDSRASLPIGQVGRLRPSWLPPCGDGGGGDDGGDASCDACSDDEGGGDASSPSELRPRCWRR